MSPKFAMGRKLRARKAAEKRAQRATLRASPVKKRKHLKAEAARKRNASQALRAAATSSAKFKRQNETLRKNLAAEQSKSKEYLRDLEKARTGQACTLQRVRTAKGCVDRALSFQTGDRELVIRWKTWWLALPEQLRRAAMRTGRQTAGEHDHWDPGFRGQGHFQGRSRLNV